MGILLIDPNNEDRSRIESLLQSFGYHNIYAFAQAQEAETKLSLNHETTVNTIFSIDTIIIDVSQGSTYLKLIEKMKRSYIFQNVTIIATSDHNRAEAMSSAFAYGASDFLGKPVEEFELKARVRSSIKLKFEIKRRLARERELLEATNQLSDLNELLANLSLIDSLTGIPNRRCLEQTLDKEWRRAERNNLPLTFIMIDIDYFKQFNDTYGHQLGDNCLLEVARGLKTQLRRPGDFIARYGGEEFSIILPGTSADLITGLCEQLNKYLKSLRIPHEASKVADHVTISMGIASAIPKKAGPSSLEGLIKEADEALYNAKANGRNQFVFATSSNKKEPA